MVVEVGDAVGHVDHKENHVGLLNGYAHLLIDFFFKYVVGINHPSACVDD